MLLSEILLCFGSLLFSIFFSVSEEKKEDDDPSDLDVSTHSKVS